MLNVILVRSYKIWISILCIACIIAFAPVQASTFDKDRWNDPSELDQGMFTNEEIERFSEIGEIGLATVIAIIGILLVVCMEAFDHLFSPDMDLETPDVVYDGEFCEVKVILHNEFRPGTLVVALEAEEDSKGYFECPTEITEIPLSGVEICTDETFLCDDMVQKQIKRRPAQVTINYHVREWLETDRFTFRFRSHLTDKPGDFQIHAYWVPDLDPWAITSPVWLVRYLYDMSCVYTPTYTVKVTKKTIAPLVDENALLPTIIETKDTSCCCS